ncbi:hypothetical protein SNE40_008069 [Patella caerulea]|uniref:Aminotransferase class I/classII large domain-containing protein n=1 Tax=Patella caerulea TaxID=87958 RepID=A0AAN8JY38_PATCE
MANTANPVGRLFEDICTMAAKEIGIVNLGRGFPDFSPPQHVLDALVQVTQSSNPLLHQYTRSFGHVRLVQALCKLYSPYYNQHLDPYQNILIPVGAYGALVCAIDSTVQEGDEVIIFEPFFDAYKKMINDIGATPVFIPLAPRTTESSPTSHSDDWTFDEQFLLSKIRANTKAILLNSPSNPLGKVFNQRELEIIRDICIEFDLICISDEVYEWMMFNFKKHIKIATMEGMWERTLTIGSAGKTFSATGWKLGWVIGPEPLIKKCQVIFQKCYYRCPTPIQEAVAIAIETEMTRLESEDCYLKSLARDLENKRDYLASLLAEIGLKPILPGGGYFLVADVFDFHKQIKDSELEKHSSKDEADDVRFVKWAIKEKKFGAIPVSVFYSDENKRRQHLIRLCFAKQLSTLEKAGTILKHW